jgi:hypothetical protein
MLSLVAFLAVRSGCASTGPRTVVGGVAARKVGEIQL